MKKGQTVTIYEDPITQRKPEGEARLVNKLMHYDDGTEYWTVEFLSEPGDYYNRLIYTREVGGER